MHFSSLLLAAVALLPAAFVGAQSDTATSPAPTATAGISPCILSCVDQASSSAGCSGITDVQCLCTSSDFQTAAASCLESNCSADDITAGQALQQQQCASITSSAAESASSEGTSLTSEGSSAVDSITSAASSALSSAASSLSSRVSSASTAASSAASEAASNSAGGTKVFIGTSALVSGVIGILGVGVGALLV